MSQTPLTPGERVNRSGGSGVRKAQAAETEARLKDAARRVFARARLPEHEDTGHHGRGRTSRRGSFYNHFATSKRCSRRCWATSWPISTSGLTTSAPITIALDRATLREHVAACWYT